MLRVLEVTDIWDSLSVIDETFCIAPRPVSGKLRECLSTGFPTIPRKEVSKNQNPNFMQGIGNATLYSKLAWAIPSWYPICS